MSTKVVEVDSVFLQDGESAWVSNLWDVYHQARSDKLAEWLELRNYIFATDTSTTSNAVLPWKNSTTTPKLCQIRDNLHSNYISALFPNDNWLSWRAYNENSSIITKARSIEAYMTNKCNQSHFRNTVSKLVYDYIDYGNAFATVEWVSQFQNKGKMLAPTKVYVGPRLIRISPMDIVFNPLADDFSQTYKIIRSVKTIGEIYKLVETNPEQTRWKEFLARRHKIAMKCAGMSTEDFQKQCGYSADGFGDMKQYFQGELVEILEFYGDYYDPTSGKLTQDVVITIADRSFTVRNEPQESWFGIAPIWQVGWRFRQDNLWAMGPLDNLVGMQYRIDHLENLKADAMDLVVHPPLAIVGEVEEFVWGPGEEIHLDEGGSIQALTKDLSGLAVANNEIANLEAKMELYAGAPREAMGMRTPGEKTALEVQTLNNASGRIFQEKTSQFETELLEPSLNGMLELSVRNLDTTDTIEVLNDELGFTVFRTITRNDITASGILRPIGARHFTKQAQDVQNLTQLMQTPLGQSSMPHLSGKAAYKLIEDISNMTQYKLFSDFVAIAEQREQATHTNVAQEGFLSENTQSLPPGM
jgi:hypothetical protein